MEVFDAWRAAVGATHVEVGQAALARAATATYATGRAVLGIVSPGSTAEVQACMVIANAYGVPVYPVSAGRNWGLGSRVPAGDGQVLLDLGRMNRILEFDEALAYITVEPGVTFRQVHAFLHERASGLLCPVIGGPADASLIGNAVERGDAAGPYRDRASFVCGLEVVLPSGELVHTGFGRFTGTRLTPLNRWGVGPALDGLFSQSNLGIVTRMTVWLTPEPTFMQVFTCRFAEPASLAGAIDALRPLALSGVLGDAGFSFWNSYKLAARAGQYPGEATSGIHPWPPDQPGSAPWFGCGAVYSASRELGVAARALVEAALGPWASNLQVADTDTAGAALAASTFNGVPTDANLASIYRRMGTPVPPDPDPDRDGCGVLWVCPAFPHDGSALASILPELEAEMLGHGFEPNIGFHAGQGRCLHGYLAIIYDRGVPGEDDRALACHDRLLSLLVAAGYYPFRLSTHAMRALPSPDDDSLALLGGLKRALDPNRVLAPGRYDFQDPRPVND